MGAYLNKPITDKETETGENGRVRFAATTMQGWRVNQEDAHNCIVEFDDDCSLFAVYDGHGGSEVAKYTALHLPDFLKANASWKVGDYAKALEDAFLEFDALLRSEAVMKELKAMAGVTNTNRNENSDDEDKEASMPLESLLEKYGFAFHKDRNGKTIINFDELHALREHHERLIASGAIVEEENSGDGVEKQNDGTGEQEDDEDQDGDDGEVVDGGEDAVGDENDINKKAQKVNGAEKGHEEDGILKEEGKENGEEGREEEEEKEGEAKKKETKKENGYENMSSKNGSKEEPIKELKKDGGGGGNKKDKEKKEMEEVMEEDGDQNQNQNQDQDADQDEDGNGQMVSSKPDDKKMKRRVCESPSVVETAKRTKSSEQNSTQLDQHHQQEDEPSTAASAATATTTTTTTTTTQRRYCFSESHSSICTTSDSTNDNDEHSAHNNGHATLVGTRRERASKSESEAVEMEKQGNDETKNTPDMRQIADQCRSSAKPQPSATPETQTAVSSDSEQSVDDDYNADEEMSEDEEESEEIDEDEQAYSGPSGDTPGEDSGTTACVLLLFKDKVIVANAGDSRAVLCRKGVAIDLSTDHKPEDDCERARIEAAGGEISLDGRVNGGLNLSRALGDHFYKKNESLPLKEQMISAQPDIKHHSIEPNDEFVIVACDGIWNSLSSQDAVDFVRKGLSNGLPLRDICEQMCNECLSPNTGGDGTGCDNMTVIVAELSR